MEELEDEPDLAPRSRASASSPRRVMVVPSMMISPVVGVSSPAIKPSSVDLPLPEGPTIGKALPRGDDEVDRVEDGQRTARRSARSSRHPGARS